MPVFYDTHAHLDYPDYAGDLPEVIERAQAAGIIKIGPFRGRLRRRWLAPVQRPRGAGRHPPRLA
jgi:hypothetical protein